MFWAIFILTVFVVGFGMAIYRADKKVKAKYGQDVNPSDWNLSGHIVLPNADAPSISLPSEPVPVAVPVEKVRYQKKALLFNSAKLEFIKALRAALKEDFAFLSHVNAADVLSVVAGGNRLAAQVAGNNIAAKQMDFVVCDPQQLRPVCCVLLSDERPQTLLGACESAGLPLVVFTLKDAPDAATIRAAILAALGVNEAALAVNSAVLDSSVLASVDAPKTSAKSSAIEFKTCPRCAAVMLKRKAKTGADAGKLFWICSTYPKCRGMLAVT